MLENLPIELVLCITDYLEKPDAVCLSLCSHRLLGIIGQPCLPEDDRKLKTAVVTRIAADLPSMFCCLSCARLHRTAAVSHPNLHMELNNKCPHIGMHNGSYLDPLWTNIGINYNFRYSHLLAVMKNYYNGHISGLTVESLAYTEVISPLSRPEFTWLLSVDGRICPTGGKESTLILQAQNWLLFHGEPNIDKIMSHLRSTYTCFHQALIYSFQDLYMRPTVQGQAFDQISACGPKHLYCPFCGIEYRIDFQDCETDGNAIVITKWLDLGAGLDADDPKWKRITAKVTALFDINGAKRSSGELAKLFRNASHIQDKESDPTDRNMGYLIDKQYRRCMYKYGYMWSSIRRQY
ncbi:hypothetical protein BDW69DRAFT_192183 [Aspergillus filifer]